MKICDQIKIKMLDGAVCSDEEMRHIETCQECRDLTALIKRIDDLPAMEQDVPAYLDKAVLQAAAASMPKSRWNPVIWKIAVPLAAAFAFVAGLLFYQPSPSNFDDSSPRIALKSGAKRNAVSKQVAVNAVAHRNFTNNSATKKIGNPVQNETTFDEQVLALAIDVGSEFDYLPESFDSVSETIDLII